MLKIGDMAPDFSLESSNGDTVKLSEYINKSSVVLIFYPGDETPGCTKQLCAVRDDYADFGKKNVAVFGVNPADRQSHEKFVNRYNFPFPLLIDAGSAVAKTYGCVLGPAIKRTVYGIGRDGSILFAQRGMPSNKEILAAISD